MHLVYNLAQEEVRVEVRLPAISTGPIVKENSTAEADMPPPDIFEPCTQSAPDESAIGQSLGDLFGKQASPTKNYVCKEKNCKKRATFTHEAEDDDSIAILCADHAKNIPGTYICRQRSSVNEMFFFFFFFFVNCFQS